MPFLTLPAVPTFTSDPATWSGTVTFFVNGVAQSVVDPDPTLHLIDYLRDVLMLKAPKVLYSGVPWGSFAPCQCTADRPMGMGTGLSS